MEFKQLNTLVKKQFAIMAETGKLFRVDVSGDRLWTAYLANFEITHTFRDPSTGEHDCNTCHNFIRRYGNVVAISNEGTLLSMFDAVLTEDMGEYSLSIAAMRNLIVESTIVDVFFEDYRILKQELNYERVTKRQDVYRLGIEVNHKQYTALEFNAFPGTVETGKIYEFHHFQIDLPRAFVNFTAKSLQSIHGTYRYKYNVFKRAMDEISKDTLILVLELIQQGSLLDGDSQTKKLEFMIRSKDWFDAIQNEREASIACWHAIYDMPETVSKFKNDLIGVLCTELSEGKDLSRACKDWNIRKDPVNYHKATAPISQRQIAEAEKFLEENNYTASFGRKLATIEDMRVEEIQFINVGSALDKPAGKLFKDVKATSSQHKRAEFDKVDTVSIDKFMTDILPNCTSVEAYLQNDHLKNMVVMTTTESEVSKQIFKWNNNFSWTFEGNLAGKSEIKEAVKSAGGNVEGVVNFRLAWNDGEMDNSDLDAWATEPNGTRIGFSTSYGCKGGPRTPMSGQLDVDIQRPRANKMAVENITWTYKSMMQPGKYELYVHQFANRGNSRGFLAELDIEGSVYKYQYAMPISNKKMVHACTVTLDAQGNFSVEHHIPLVDSHTKSTDIWGLDTNKFHKVNLLCLSPNHWGTSEVGNKHFMFMLEGCKTSDKVRGFHNENLNGDLLKHRKVLEVLGNTAMIEPTDKQLAGLGFNSTVRAEVILRLKGHFSRVIKVQF